MTHRLSSHGTFAGACAAVGPDGRVYALPYDAHRVLRVTPAAASASGDDEVGDARRRPARPEIDIHMGSRGTTERSAPTPLLYCRPVPCVVCEAVNDSE